jgi:hypothetical protein
MENLSFIRNLTPEEVFEIWRANEAHLPHWQEYLKHEKEGVSWEQWRSKNARKFGLYGKEWKLYQVENPCEVVPSWFGGPFDGWSEYYGGQESTTFARLTETSAAEIPAVKAMVESFPNETTVTALVRGGRVVVIEGMHRCVALAVRSRIGKACGDTLFQVALARDDS